MLSVYRGCHEIQYLRDLMAQLPLTADERKRGRVRAEATLHSLSAVQWL